MDATLPIGDFARATHLSVKTLRYYHRVGLLEPDEVDRHTGHRYYTTAQIPTAQIIRRFRALDMPVEQIAKVLTAPDLDTRNALLAAHLHQMEQELARTQSAVVSLRDLLTRPPGGTRAEIGRRSVPATSAAAITETVDVAEALTWYQGALGEIYATLDAQGLAAGSPAGGIFSTDLFTHEHGPATVFVPCTEPVRPMGRVDALVVPPAELATIIHRGPHTNIDLAYGTLGAYVAEHALAVDGPIREYYPVARRESPDPATWRTEICWPIFHTGPSPHQPAEPKGDGGRQRTTPLLTNRARRTGPQQAKPSN
ncbi:MerR family transcriptional regulator [Streptomyces sp. NPDC001980]|uniref:MerR family transcriptional regulator n=1 Tax=Streptomyces sp. NPDC001980 TaxID=3157126 RepID=UPI003324C861